MFKALDKIKESFGSNATDTKRFNDIVAEEATSVLKELGGYGIKESKAMVDNIVLFTNCSGGTGVSTIVSNLAYILASKMFNMSVLVIDMNLICPVQHIYFDKRDGDNNGGMDIVDILTGQCSIGDATVTNGNISLIYAVNRSVADEINCEDNIAVDNFESMLGKVRDLYDIILIDCPMRISNSLCNTAMYMADKIYTVWDEGISSILNTDRDMRQLGFTGIDSFAKMMVVMNKKTSVKYSKFPFEKLNLSLIETLPFSTDIIYSSLDASIYCENGKARNKNGGEFERHMYDLARKVVALGGRTSLEELIGDNKEEKEAEESQEEQPTEEVDKAEDSGVEPENKEANAEVEDEDTAEDTE